MRRITIALLSGDNPRLAVRPTSRSRRTPCSPAPGSSSTPRPAASTSTASSAMTCWSSSTRSISSPISPPGLALREGTDVIAGISLRWPAVRPDARGTRAAKRRFEDPVLQDLGRFNVTWGDEAPPDPVEIEDVSGLVDGAEGRPATGRATFPANSRQRRVGASCSSCARDDRPASLRRPRGQPEGRAAWLSRFEKFGNKKPDVDRFELSHRRGRHEEQREEFAIAQFKKMSDADKLSRSSFDRLRSGLTFLDRRRNLDRRRSAEGGQLRAELRPPQVDPARRAL